MLRPFRIFRSPSIGAAVSALLTAAPFINGCAPPGHAAIQTHSAGDFAAAKNQIMAIDPAARDRFLVLAEQGKISLDAGDPATARQTLAEASDWAERYAIYEPKTTITEEAASIAINQTMRTYRGTYADRIMVDAYAVLAQLWLGELSMAAVYANRVAERQTDAEVEQQKQIDKVQKEIGSYRGGSVNSLVRQVRESEAMRAVAPNAPPAAETAYLNPFASWISAIAWSATGDGSYLERARTALRQAIAMAPANSVLRAQLERNPFELGTSRPQVIVLFEGCRSTSLQQLLIPLITPWAGFSSIPLPIPEHHACDVSTLAISTSASGANGAPSGGVVHTEPLSDNDAIFMAQYDRMLPEIIFRTAVMIAVKEGATVAGTQATRNNDAAQIGILVGMSIYKAITNQADLRSFRSVGKYTQIAQVDRPADGVLRISVVGASGLESPAAEVPLPHGSVVMVYVRGMNSGATVIYAFPLAGMESTAAPGVRSSS